LFGSDKWIKSLGLSEFVEKYRPWLSLTFTITMVLFAVDRCLAFFAWLGGYKQAKDAKRASTLEDMNWPPSVNQPDKQQIAQ
jgi:hypothetical protein